MNASFSRSITFPLCAVLLGSLAPSFACAQLVRDAPPNAPAGKKRLSQEVALSGGDHWVDTSIDVRAGEHVLFAASGKMRYTDAQVDHGPEGQPRGWRDLLRILPVKDGGHGAVIARIGDADIGQPLLVGAKRDFTAPVNGRLFLGLNQEGNDSADGDFTVHIEVYAPEASAPTVPVARDVAKVAGVDAPLFAKIPRRISDKNGKPGDMVNFLILGSETAVQQVFDRAGWVKVDSTPEEAVLHGLLESLAKESYVRMPMSQLYLFGRYQDYGFAHAEPIAVVAQRHHLRLWKAPFTVGGQTLWVGAATHDIGFERDQRNNGITHKIDPDIDAEREYVGKTLSATGLVAEKTHFTPENPMKEAKTATGGSFHSNGQVLVFTLAEPPKSKDAPTSFAPERKPPFATQRSD